MHTSPMIDVEVRRELGSGDAEAMIDLQERVYRSEYGLDDGFRAEVAPSVHAAVASGWPESGGAVWLVDRIREGHREMSGSLALTVERPRAGRVRWFVLAPELRGQGLGRALLTELLAEAREQGMEELVLSTFSALTAAAQLYREAGFHLVSGSETDKWGPQIVFQHYELTLR